MAITESDREVTDSPVYWFVLLEAARDNSDFTRAAAAQRELERLGVAVRYRRLSERRDRRCTG